MPAMDIVLADFAGLSSSDLVEASMSLPRFVEQPWVDSWDGLYCWVVGLDDGMLLHDGLRVHLLTQRQRAEVLEPTLGFLFSLDLCDTAWLKRHLGRRPRLSVARDCPSFPQV